MCLRQPYKNFVHDYQYSSTIEKLCIEICVSTECSLSKHFNLLGFRLLGYSKCIIDRDAKCLINEPENQS